MKEQRLLCAAFTSYNLYARSGAHWNANLNVPSHLCQESTKIMFRLLLDSDTCSIRSKVHLAEHPGTAIPCIKSNLLRIGKLAIAAYVVIGGRLSEP